MKTLDSTTTASVPGRLTVCAAKYAKYYGTGGRARWLLRACAHLPWAARILPVIGPRIRHWTRTREHLEYGCLNPAVVLDADRGLVAVFATLAARSGRPAPVIKILRERLDLIDQMPARTGSRFAAACLYARTDEIYAQGQWSDVFPIIVDCLSDDYQGCRRAARDRLKPSDWTELELCLQTLSGDYREGLHHIDVPDDMTWEEFLSMRLAMAQGRKPQSSGQQQPTSIGLPKNPPTVTLPITHYANPKNRVLLIQGAVLLLLVCVWALQLPVSTTGLHGRFLAWVGVVLLPPAAAYHLIRLVRRQPSVVLDANGLRDLTSAFPAGLVPWQEIDSVAVTSLKGTKQVSITLKDNDRFLARLGPVHRALAKTALRMGCPVIGIAETEISIQPEQLADQIQECVAMYAIPSTVRAAS